MVQLGWKAGPEQYGPVELLEYAVAADKAGFDLLDVSDHFHPWSEAGQCPFTWTWLGAAAVQTSKIRVGTGVTCPIERYHPAIIAQAAATVSRFAPRRIYLGVGTGEALNEYVSHPVPMIISSLYSSTLNWGLTLSSSTRPVQISVLLLNAMAVIYCPRYAL